MKKPTTRIRKALRGLCLVLLVALLGLIAVSLRGIVFVYSSDADSLLALVRPAEVTGIRGGQVVALRPRGWVSPNEVSQLVEALIAREDAEFESHNGVSMKGLARGFLSYLHVPRFHGGGSTLTMQVARLVYSGHCEAGDKRKLPGVDGNIPIFSTLERKASEVYVALWLEHNLFKDEILTLYLNLAYWSHGIRGIDAASRTVFGAPVTDLPTPHCLLLTAFVQLPTRSLYPQGGVSKSGKHYTSWVQLTNRVASIYHANGRANAWAVPENYNFVLGRALPRRRAPPPVSHWLRKEVLHQLRLEGIGQGQIAGGQIVTPIDFTLQQTCSQALARLPRGVEGAVAVVDVSGAIHALVGGRSSSGSCRATVVRIRGLHSTIKGFIYAAGFEAGLLTSDTWIPATPLTIHGRPWPGERSRLSGPEVPVAVAFYKSVNAAAVRLLVYRPQVAREFSRICDTLGIPAPRPGKPADLIGNGPSGINLVELAAAYACFINRGLLPEPYVFRSVKSDRDAEVRGERVQLRRLVSPETAQATTNLLLETVTNRQGTAHRLHGILPEPVGAKTGSHANDQRVVVVLPKRGLVIAIWVGFDTPRSLPRDGLALQVAQQVLHFLATPQLTAIPSQLDTL